MVVYFPDNQSQNGL